MFCSKVIINDEYDRYVALALELGDPFPYNVPFVGLQEG